METEPRSRMVDTVFEVCDLVDEVIAQLDARRGPGFSLANPGLVAAVLPVVAARLDQGDHPPAWT